MAVSRLRIECRFPSGRFHATPWGRHVNEGAIEWPPSPWRIGRALIATGFTKAGWRRMPEVAGAIILRLASTPPIYHLPPATTAHTRHYMPTHKGSATRVIDAFVVTSRSSVLVMEWTLEVSLSEVEALDSLLRRMNHLGRAESWIEAQRVDEVPRGLMRCVPGEEPPGPDWERVELLAVMPADEYAEWRAQVHTREADRRLERKRERARDLGRRRPRSLSKSLRVRLEAELPATAVDALCADTAELHRAGWSRPPGTHWLTYWRPRDALEARPRATGGVAAQGVSHESGVAEMGPEAPRAALLRLMTGGGKGSRLPAMRDALWRCDAVHKALVRLSATIDPEGRPASCFTGRDDRHMPLQGHRHTTLMPLADDRRSVGQIGHIVVYTPMGLDEHALAALHTVQVTYGRDLPPLGMVLVAVGQPEELADRIPMFAEARVWESYTPFVPPRYLKPTGKYSLVGQVVAELVGRGLPAPVAVDVQVTAADGPRYLAGTDFWPLWTHAHDGGVRLADKWRAYRRVRQGGAPRPPIDAAFGLRLTFAEPVHGPISLGYASHFGLGLFVPSCISDPDPP